MVCRCLFRFLVWASLGCFFWYGFSSSCKVDVTSVPHWRSGFFFLRFMCFFELLESWAGFVFLVPHNFCFFVVFFLSLQHFPARFAFVGLSLVRNLLASFVLAPPSGTHASYMCVHFVQFLMFFPSWLGRLLLIFFFFFGTFCPHDSCANFFFRLLPSWCVFPSPPVYCVLLFRFSSGRVSRVISLFALVIYFCVKPETCRIFFVLLMSFVRSTQGFLFATFLYVFGTLVTRPGVFLPPPFFFVSGSVRLWPFGSSF